VLALGVHGRDDGEGAGSARSRRGRGDARAARLL